MKKQESSAEIKKILKEQRLEYQRYLSVVVESFQSQVKLIAESLSDVQKTLTGIQKQLVVLRDMVVKNTEDIEIIKTDIFTMKSDMEIMKSDIEIIKGGIKKKVDYEEFSALEKRITLLESKMRR